MRELLDQMRSACVDASHQGPTSLPPQAYWSPELFALETAGVLEAGWQAVCRVEQLAGPGSFYSVDLLGRPLVVTRDAAGDIHVLSRTCRHRMMDVAQGAGAAGFLQCPYHCWTYELDGTLRGAPLMDKVVGFDKTKLSLPSVRHELWHGFVFVNLNGEAESIAVELSDLEPYLENYEIDGYQLVDVSDWDCPWNWKIMVENFMECYHHLGIHAASVERTFPARTTWSDQGGDNFSVLHVPRRDSADDPVPTLPGSRRLTPSQVSEVLVFAIYPTFVVTLGPGYLYWLRILPTAPDKIELQVQICMSAAALADARFPDLQRELVADIVVIHQEDLEVCASVQRAARSPLAQAGPLSVLERPLAEFYHFLGRKLGIADGAEKMT